MADEVQPMPEDETPAPAPTVVLRDKYGRRFAATPDKADEALRRGGFRMESDEEAKQVELQKKYGGTAGEIKAGLAGAARGLTADLSDVALTKSGLVKGETLEGLKQANPATSAVTETGTMLGSLLIPGLGEASIPGLVGRVGAGAAERLGGGLAARAAAGGLEAGIFGLGNTLSESSLGESQLNAQKLVANVGLSALMGSGGSLALAGLGRTARAGLRAALDRGEGAESRIAGAADAAAEATPAAQEAETQAAAGGTGEGAPPSSATPPGETPEPAPEPASAGQALKDAISQTYGAAEQHIKDVTLANPRELLKREADLRYFKATGAIQSDMNGITDERAREIGRDLADAGMVPPGSSPREVLANVQRAKPVQGKLMNGFLDRADEAAPIEEAIPAEEDKPFEPAAGGFDMGRALTRIRDDLYNKVAGNHIKEKYLFDALKQALPEDLVPAKASLKDLFSLADDPEIAGRLRTTFRAANDTEGSFTEGLYSKLDAKQKVGIARQVGGILNNEIETQLGEALGGDAQAQFKEAKRMMGSLIVAEKSGIKGVRRLSGNREISLTDYLSGAGIGATVGGPLGMALGAAGALFNKAARERGSSFVGHALDALASHPAFDSFANGFSSFYNRMKGDAPAALGGFKTLLDNAAARGADELLLTHAALSQMSPQYREAMTGLGLDFNQSPAEVAAKAERLQALRQRLAQHDADTQTAAKAALGGQAAAAGEAAMRSPLLGDSQSGPLKGWQDRVNALNAFAQNPKALADKIAMALGPFSDMAPELGAAMAQTAARAASFLQSKAPQSTDPYQGIPALARPFEPSDSAKERFGRYLEAASNPAGVLQALGRGNVSKEAIETLQAVYPELHGDMKQKMMNALAAHKDELPLAQKVSLGRFMGQPLDDASRPDRLLALQALHSGAGAAQHPAQGGAPQAPKGRALKGNPKDTLAQGMTYSQKIESR